MLKKCSKCRQEKDTSCFGKAKERKDGLKPWCKECRKTEYQSPLRKKQWYKNNRDLTLERVKNRNIEKKEEIQEYKIKYYNENRESEIARARKYYCDNRVQIRKKANEKLKTPESIKYRKEYYRKYNYRWASRRLVSMTLKWIGQKKTERTHILLGYSALDLKLHLESLWSPGMNWENYGEWHIDHIRPICSFDKNCLVAEINALKNLQPLWATTRTINGITYEGNLNKNKRYDANAI